MTPVQTEEFTGLLSRLASIRIRWLAIDTFRGGSLVIASAAGLLLCALFLDRIWPLPAAGLYSIDCAVVATIISVLFLALLRPVFRRRSDESIAIHIEDSYRNLEGQLINAVQLGKSSLLSSNPFTSLVVRKNCHQLEKVDFSPALPWRKLKSPTISCVLAIALAAAYGIQYPDHFQNSMKRYLFPSRGIAPLTATIIDSVEPGDAILLSGTDLVVRAKLSGDPPSQLFLRVGTEKNWRELTDPTIDAQGRPQWSLPHITRAMDYQVVAGDAISQIFHIELTETPGVKSLDIALSFPDYTNRAPEQKEAHGGNIEALVGTEVKLLLHANKPLKSAELRRSNSDLLTLSLAEDKITASGTFTIVGNETYWFVLADTAGNPNVDPVKFSIVALKDQSPSVQLISSTEEVKLRPDEILKAPFAALDDYGIAAARLKVEVTRAFDRSTQNLDPVALKIAVVRADLTDEFTISALKLKLLDGDVLRYQIEVEDAIGQSALSATRAVQVIRPGSSREGLKAKQNSDLERLKELLTRQQENLVSTKELTDQVGVLSVVDDLDVVTAEQMKIRHHAARLADELSPAMSREMGELKQIARKEMTEALEALDDAGKTSRRSSKRRHLLEASLIQEEIVKKLLRLAAMGKDLVDATEKARGKVEIPKDPTTDEDNQKSLDAFKEKLTNFYKEQKANLLDTQKLLNLPEDSDEAAKLARKVIERQRLVKDLVREAKDMTETLKEKEITNEQLIERMDDVFRAVSDAVKAAERKDFRRTLLKEEMAILMADAIPNNGEAFLTQSSGNKTKWDFEDWPEEERPETKLPPIPPDMHDTLGELIDAQDELAEDEDDMQSQMHYGATDSEGLIGGDSGPLSNMMAKGRSGNTKPKNNEVGGRSGSGRTGKSSGEFVEEVDVAKEGRETEDRYTKEQEMAGFVKSQGEKKRSGGSTSSGGKMSDEATEFGLRGDSQVRWSKQRLQIQEKQDDLRLKTELFAQRLKEIMGRPDFDVNSALLLMQEVEADLSGGRFEHAARKQILASRHLKNLHRSLAAYVARTEAESNVEGSKKTSVARKDDPLREKFPEEYRKMIEAYYKALSEADGSP